MMDNVLFIVGLIATLIIIVGLSIWTGTHKKNCENKIGLPVVTGVIMGTLVGGSSTVGTAQLAYTYGLSAWWFTLGGGIACLVLALVYARPLRHSGCPTLVGMIRREFGATAGMTASLLSVVGTFINIISQLIAATAVIAVIFPLLGVVPAVVISACFMVLYVIFGGTKGAGIIGIVKIALIYAAMVASGVIVLSIVGGFGAFAELVQNMDNPDGVNFFSLFARGVGKDLGAAISLLLGVLTTQTYAQGVLTAKSDQAGLRGALLSAFLIPPIGVGGILVGLYMRANAAFYPTLTAKTALTTFITAHMPPLFAGVTLATLFVATVGTGAGLALGISTVLNNDVVKKFSHKFDDIQKTERLAKVWIVATLALACYFSTGALGDVILQFAFMSMGLRGCVVFLPLICALWLPGRVDRKYAIASIVISPLAVLLFGVIDIFSLDSLLIGLAVSAMIIIIGLIHGSKTLYSRRNCYGKTHSRRT